MTAKRVVHVIGTGTIGEPLIGLLTDMKEKFGLDEVTFHKRTPLKTDRSKVRELQHWGAQLAVDSDAVKGFEEIGIKPTYLADEALEKAGVVIDCTPVGNANKSELYEKHASSTLGFIAQGSEFGFGKPYARGINDAALKRGEDKFIQVVSCNTHNLSVLIDNIALAGGGPENLKGGRFLCIRRANDISQDGNFAPSPQVGKHKDEKFGTHHARDAWHLFNTLGYDLENLYSSALKINSQYMHCIWFSITLDKPITREAVLKRFEENDRVALTYKTSANSIFSFGRDYGHYGRILSQTVVPVETLAVKGDREVVGFCFTPQDGNPLVSSVAAALWFMHPDDYEKRLQVLRHYLFQEV